MKKVFLIVLVSCLGLLINGCIGAAVVGGAAAGAAGYAYYKGELKSTENIPVSKLWEAVTQMIEEAKIIVEERTQDAFTAIVKARQADGTPIRIVMKRVTDNVSELRIKVGTFGNQSEALEIYRQIKSYIK